MSMGNLPFPSFARMHTHPLAVLVTLALVLPLLGASAQAAARARRGPAGVTLRVQPAPGDVFQLLLEQTMEVSSVRREPMPLPPLAGRATAPPSERDDMGPRRDRTPGRVTVMSVYGRSTVDSRDVAGVVMLATIDSMRVQAGESGGALSSQRVPLSANTTSRLRVAPNGAMSLLDGGAGASAVAPTLSAMPAMLPEGIVRVGDTWEHEVSMPPLPFTAYRTDGVLHTVFRLDSVSRRTGDAWVSVTGTMRRDGPTRDLPPGTRVITAGTLQGTLHFDRSRAWITDATTTVFLQSEIVNPGDGSLPTHVGIRLTQRMRVR
jgi:hypothetical protein